MKELNEELKEQAIDKMTEKMAALRTMLNYSQEELAKLIGVGRQTLVSIETRKRKMTWNTFLSLLFVFSQHRETAALLEYFGIYSNELKQVYQDSNLR